MNALFTLTPSQQRLQHLLSLTRPLTDKEADDLYRCLHADYMRKWRAARLENEMNRQDLAASNTRDAHLLDRMRMEARR